ncbi:MAG: glycerophosphodiester phosphodiesterase, partial [Chloroflexi bacterium]|nr:glycerophosphodiester phosphodiesterase [Chloroflexota bacterium]
TATALGELGVPTLESVLEVVGPQPFLDVEIKDDPSPAIVEVLEAGRGPGLERAVVSSFDPATLDFIGRRAPGWPRWLISHTLDDADIAWARALGCAGICVQWRALRPGAIRHAQESDLEVISWTVRRRSTFDRLERLGIVASAVEASALDG